MPAERRETKSCVVGSVRAVDTLDPFAVKAENPIETAQLHPFEARRARAFTLAIAVKVQPW
jgi:hypothetical protein